MKKKENSLYKKLLEKKIPLDKLAAPTGAGDAEMTPDEIARQQMMSDMAANNPEEFSLLQKVINEVRTKKLGEKDIERLIRMRAELEGNNLMKGRAPQSEAFAENVPLPQNTESLIGLRGDIRNAQLSSPGGGMQTMPGQFIEGGGLPFNQAQLMLKQIRGEMRTPQDMADHAEGMLDSTIAKGKKAKTVKNLLKNMEDLMESEQGADAPYP